MNSGGTFRKLAYHFLLILRGMNNHRLIVCFRPGQVQLIRCLDISDFGEQLHQFRKIEKLCKPGPGTIAGPFRGKLDSRCGFPKRGSPAIELTEALLLQSSILQIALHGVQFRH